MTIKTRPIRTILPSSFRDPDGFLFKDHGHLYRQINQSYKHNYDLLVDSGLYQALTRKGYLVAHEEVNADRAVTSFAYKVIKPELIPFVSYPYEWSFSQLKDAALLTLDVQLTAMRSGMTLKDASAFNVQYLHGKPIFIDTLSFEKKQAGAPWIAYRQFCQHFLCPLALMSFVDIGFNQLFRIHIDGIPLRLASRLLPYKTLFRWSLLANIHLHASAQRKHAGKISSNVDRKLSDKGVFGIILGLQRAVEKLQIKKQKSEWENYYEDTNYSPLSTDAKAEIISTCLNIFKPRSVWDLGANIGKYSRIASQMGIPTLAFDIDANAVEQNYLACRASGEANILPLIMDLSNPSSGIGWSCTERLSLYERGPVDMILALALVHHLAISNNVPLEKIAKLFSELGLTLIIEFVSKKDTQVTRLLKSRNDIFTEYNQERFESAFSEYFSIETQFPVPRTERIIYLMKKKS